MGRKEAEKVSLCDGCTMDRKQDARPGEAVGGGRKEGCWERLGMSADNFGGRHY